MNRVAVLSTVALSLMANAAVAQLSAFKDTERDATEALQRLITERDGLVELPPGTYRISAPLEIDLAALGYRGLRGANGATRIVMTGPGPAITIRGTHQGTASPGAFSENVWEKERFPVLSGFEILGAHPEADGVQLFQTMQCTIQNMLIRECRYGVHLMERNRNFLLADSHIYNGGDTGVFFEHCNMHQANLIGNHISYNKRAGIRQTGGELHNIQIAGNDIEYNHGADGNSGEIVVEGDEARSSEWTIASNTIQARPENHGANILMLGNVSDGTESVRIVSITGNIIGSRNENIRIARAMKVSIAGNTIYGAAALNVRVAHSQDVVLADNAVGTRPWIADRSGKYIDGVLFDGCRNSGIHGNVLHRLRAGDADGGGAVHLRNCVFTRVSDCQILDPAVRGIHVAGGEACAVRGNSIATSETPTITAAIEVSGKAHSVRDNDIWTAIDTPLKIAEGAGMNVGNAVHGDGVPPVDVIEPVSGE